MAHYFVDYLQAVEPEHLPVREGVEVTVMDEAGGMGFPQVEVRAADRAALIAYCEEVWPEDPDWFREYVVARVIVWDDGDAADIRTGLWSANGEGDKVPFGARTFVAHLNIVIPHGDKADSDAVAKMVEGMLEVGSDDERVHGWEMALVFAEEV